uniref:PilZ domain-containing protein n=1 Tax=Magnetococcus massalia (strain MO-1) TaxID=451514 RepID=A0A1S7LKZ4_MAGMO|nr:conserved protein of unknown function (include C terminal PilZ domain) [Candidatus Magnetococcus massalia]
MTATPGVEQSLRTLAPFFKQYARHFVRHFFSQMRLFHGENAVSNEAAPVVGYLFYRHFYPGISTAQLPKLDAEQMAQYQEFLKDTMVLSATLQAMEKDLRNWLEKRVHKQMMAFGDFTAHAFADGLREAGLDAEEISIAEEKLARRMAAVEEEVAIAVAEKTAASMDGEEAKEAAADADKPAAEGGEEGESRTIGSDGKPVPQGEEEGEGEEQPAEEEEEGEPPTPLELLMQLKESGTTPLCFNVYKGVPISYESEILDIYDVSEQVVLKLHRYQSFVVGEERFTMIKDEALPFPIQADVVSLQRDCHEVKLENLRFASGGAGGRATVRVKPAEPVPMTVLGDGRKIKATLLDISATGMGVLTTDTPISVDHKVDVNIELEKGQNLALHGIVMMEKEHANGEIMMGINIQPDTNADVFISQYVYQRQAEVVREIQQKSMDLFD